MCLYCDDLPYRWWWDCHFGEVCARLAGLVKYYDEVLSDVPVVHDELKVHLKGVAACRRRVKTLSASVVLGKAADWEHVIPRSVIKKVSSNPSDYSNDPVLKFISNQKLLYKKALVVALERTTHRKYVKTSGGGDCKEEFREFVANLFIEGDCDEAVFLLVQSDVGAIQQCRYDDSFPRNVYADQYVPALGAVLWEYRQKGIISPDALCDIYSWVCGELLPSAVPSMGRGKYICLRKPKPRRYVLE